VNDTLHIFRFTVRCDRETNAAIERAAKAAGLSPTGFVQRHFDGIAAMIDAATKPAPAVMRQDIERAHDLGLSVGEMRVLDQIIERTDGDEHAEIGVGSVARAVGMSDGSVRNILSKLSRLGLIIRIGRTGFRGTTVYRVTAEARAQ